MTQHCVVDLSMKNSKERILLAASKLFLNGGISALSVRAIARESNLSTIGIYSHFNGKQGILDALYILKGLLALKTLLMYLLTVIIPKKAF